MGNLGSKFWKLGKNGRAREHNGARSLRLAASRRMLPEERFEDRRLMTVEVLPDVAVDLVATAGGGTCQRL